jgi:L-glutamine---4-(methylsulfanyl)-2-oxobutanoate aminotransferase
MPQTSERTSTFTESVIRRMTRVANQYGAINLSQGYPDFDPPPALAAALADVARTGPHQYAVTWGAANFREALAAKQSRFMGLPLDPDRHLVVTCGSTEAMMAAMMTARNPGDAVIVFSPFYENYGADAILSGARPLYVPLRPPDFAFDPAELRAAFQQQPKALILCNPSNPSGKVFTREELLAIAALAEEFDAFVITDEVYEHIVYAPHRHVYFAALPGMFERTISVSSLSKTYSITGWRLGYAIAAPSVIESARKVHDFLTVGAAAPLQEAAVTALQFGPAYYAELLAAYTRKRDVFLGALDAAGLRFTTPQGAYYALVDVSEFTRDDDVGFCEWLAREVGVAAVPGSSFFREPVRHLIRFHFAKREETLAAAGERLKTLRDRWRARRGRSLVSI